MTDEKILLRNIKNYMVEHNLNQKEFSGKIGFHPTYLGNILNEKQDLTFKFIKKVSEVTRMSVSQLFTLNDKQGTKEEPPVMDGNKDSLINLLNAQIVKLKQENVELKERPTEVREIKVTAPVDNKAHLMITNGESELRVNGATVKLDEVEILNVLSKKATVEIQFDEIHIC